jgi:hypothetical protein
MSVPTQSALSSRATLSTRRSFVRHMSFGMLGLSLPTALQAQTGAPSSAAPLPPRSCILLFLAGGPSHIDTWDMKPDAPVEYRGEFRPIQTSAPGMLICEHLPRMSRVAHHVALVRSLTMTGRGVNGDGDHNSDVYYALTGHRPDRTFTEMGGFRQRQPDDWPFIGATVAFARGHPAGLPGVVQMPWQYGEDLGFRQPGQFGGRLGPEYDPLLVRGSPDRPFELISPEFTLPPDLSMERVDERRRLLAQLENVHTDRNRGDGPVDAFARHHHRAFALLNSRSLARAFELNREPRALREQYGGNLNGQSALLARRLVEAGVPFVVIHWVGPYETFTQNWDTHDNNFTHLRNNLLPAFDSCFTTLVQDLDARGLLDQTLVVAFGEMGRTPRIGDRRRGTTNGRDHWIHCQTALFAGGGIRGGQVYGSSDRVAAYPAHQAVYPEDIAATIYRAMGLPARVPLPSRRAPDVQLREDGTVLPLFS